MTINGSYNVVPHIQLIWLMTSVSLWFMVDISTLYMAYKPSYNWGGAPPCKYWLYEGLLGILFFHRSSMSRASFKIPKMIGHPVTNCVQYVLVWSRPNDIWIVYTYTYVYVCVYIISGIIYIYILYYYILYMLLYIYIYIQTRRDTQIIHICAKPIRLNLTQKNTKLKGMKFSKES